MHYEFLIYFFIFFTLCQQIKTCCDSAVFFTCYSETETKDSFNRLASVYSHCMQTTFKSVVFFAQHLQVNFFSSVFIFVFTYHRQPWTETLLSNCARIPAKATLPPTRWPRCATSFFRDPGGESHTSSAARVLSEPEVADRHGERQRRRASRGDAPRSLETTFRRRTLGGRFCSARQTKENKE